ncbi:TPA: TolC family protein [Providencia alcalifaciens]|nr:TolC family protein [Providencia alcalifaciens]
MRVRNIILGLSISLIGINISFATQSTESFHSFMDKVLDNSSPVKIKQLEHEAEEYRAKQTNYYYIPKVSASGKIKDNGGNSSQLTATSTVYDSALNNRFNEKNYRLKASELSLSKEKEDLYANITNNIIGIHYLSELTNTTNQLNSQAQDIFKLINLRYQSGVAKLSDVEQATLLMQRIETEQKNIKTEIDQYKSNIELISGIPFPNNGVQVPTKLIKKLKSTPIDSDKNEQNTEYSMLQMQADALKENAQQQDALFNVNLVAEERFVDRKKVHNESYFGVEVKVNVFDLDRKLAKLAQMKQYEAAKGKADYKYKETTARIKNLKQISSSNDIELNSLLAQLKTMQSIIKSQEREYQISQSSFYEMVNTLFDMLTIQRRIAELTIADMKNKMEYIQLTGKLTEIETSS